MAQIQIWTRDVKGTKVLGNYAPQHTFLIKINDNGAREIIRGGPINDNMIIDDITIFNKPYTESSILSDYFDPTKPNTQNYQGTTIKTASQSEIDDLWNKAWNKAQNINSQKYDYEPLTQNCNTVTYAMASEMGLVFQVESFLSQKEVWAPGFGNDFEHSAFDKAWDFLEEFPISFKNDFTTIKDWLDDFSDSRDFEDNNNIVKASFNKKYNFSLKEGDKLTQLINSDVITSQALLMLEDNMIITLKDGNNNIFTLIRDDILIPLKDGTIATLESVIEMAQTAKEVTVKFVEGYVADFKKMLFDANGIASLISDTASNIQKGKALGWSNEKIIKETAKEIATKAVIKQIGKYIVDQKIIESSAGYGFAYNVAIAYATTLILSANEDWDSQQYGIAAINITAQLGAQAALAFSMKDGAKSASIASNSSNLFSGAGASASAYAGIGAAVAYMVSAAINDIFADDHMNSKQWQTTAVSASIIGVATAMGWLVAGPVGGVVLSLVASQFMGGKEFKEGEYPNPYDFIKIVPKEDGTGNNIYAIEAGALLKAVEGKNDDLFGTNSSDIAIGASGNNTIIGYDGNDHIEGRGGNDVLIGGKGDDLIYGGSEDDIITGDAGDDVIYGDSGNDKIIGDEGDDIIYGGNGDDTISSGAGNDYISDDNGNNNIIAGDGNDEIELKAGDNNVDGEAGDDTIIGGVNIDAIIGNQGNDIIHGNDGNDNLLGGDGDDEIFGGSGIDIINGDAGSDIIDGGYDDDLILAGIGNDIIYGNDGDDTLLGEIGNDYIIGGVGSDELNGGDGDDVLLGGKGDDLMQGGLGFDSFIIGKNQGVDIIEDEGGKNIINSEIINDDVIRMVDYNVGQVVFALGNDDFTGNDLVITFIDSDNKIINDSKIIIKNQFADTDLAIERIEFADNKMINFANLTFDNDGKATYNIEDIKDYNVAIQSEFAIQYGENLDIDLFDRVNPSSSWADANYDNKANSNIDSEQYNQVQWRSYKKMRNMFGGVYNVFEKYYDTTLSGGKGNDRIVGNFWGETIYGDGYKILTRSLMHWAIEPDESNGGDDQLFGNGGNDTIYGGGGNDYINGGSENDNLFGGDGYDKIEGGSGNDIISGGKDNDTLLGQSGNDLINGNEGDDYIEGGGENDNLVGNIGNDLIIGSAGDDKIDGNEGDDMIDGSDGNDEINGNEGDDRIIGGNGEDKLNGGLGNDRIIGNAGNDFINGDLGNDTIYGRAGLDTINGGFGDDYLSGGEDNDIIYGDQGADVIYGDSGADKIFGGADNDEIFGGIGNDIIEGSDGDDNIIGGSGDNKINGGSGNDKLKGGEDYDDIEGGDGDDNIIGGYSGDLLRGGSGNDIISGGLGNDVLIDDFGNDNLIGGEDEDIFIVTYKNYSQQNSNINDENSNNNTDIIEDFDYNFDKIIIKSDYRDPLTFEEIRSMMTQNNQDVEVNFSNNHKIIIKNNIISNLNKNNFAIGLSGGKNNDIIIGSNGEDKIFGDDGNDIIYAGGGNDEIWGGKGFDALYGEDGADNLHYEADDKFITAINKNYYNDTVSSWGFSFNYHHINHFYRSSATYDFTPNESVIPNYEMNDNDDVIIKDYNVLSSKFVWSQQVFYNPVIFDKIKKKMVWWHTELRVNVDNSQYRYPAQGYDIEEITRYHYEYNLAVNYATKNFHNNQMVDITGYNRNFDYFNGGDKNEFDAITMTDGNDFLALDDPTSPKAVAGVRVANIAVIYADKGDDIVNFSSYRYNYGNITIYGGEGKDRLWGNMGNDNIFGQTGNDEIYGGKGNDILDGGSGNDEIYGGDDSDMIVSSEGADYLDGGGDGDVVSYFNSNEAVQVNLKTNQNSGGFAVGDNIKNIEHIIGSIYNDSITGNDLDNVIAGSIGDDDLTGFAGNDYYYYKIGDAIDTINENINGGIDEIRFDDGINANNINLYRQNNDLVIIVNNSQNDKIIIKEQFTDNSQKVEFIKFFDASNIDIGNLYIANEDGSNLLFSRKDGNNYVVGNNPEIEVIIENYIAKTLAGGVNNLFSNQRSVTNSNAKNLAILVTANIGKANFNMTTQEISYEMQKDFSGIDVIKYQVIDTR